MAMTQREFLESVLKIEGISEVLATECKERIAKLDKSNEARKNKPSKVQLENEPIKEKILEFVASNPKATASKVGVALEISTNKASALLKQLATEGKLTICEVKEPKKSKVNGYSLAE